MFVVFMGGTGHHHPPEVRVEWGEDRAGRRPLGARCSVPERPGFGWGVWGGRRAEGLCVPSAECREIHRVTRNACERARCRAAPPCTPPPCTRRPVFFFFLGEAPSSWMDECGLPPRTAPIPFDWRSAIGASLDRGIQSRGIDCAGALEQTASSVRVGFFPCEFDLPGGLARARSRAPAGRLHTEFG